MLLRTRIVLIFGIASIALLAALLLPLLVVQGLTEQALSAVQREEQNAAWAAALDNAATPFELLSSQMAADPTLSRPPAATTRRRPAACWLRPRPRRGSTASTSWPGRTGCMPPRRGWRRSCR